MIHELQFLIHQIELTRKLQQCLRAFRQNEKRIEAQVKAAEIRLGIQDLSDEEQRLWRHKIEGLRSDQILWLLICVEASEFSLTDFLEDTRKSQPGLLTQLLNELGRQVRSAISNN